MLNHLKNTETTSRKTGFENLEYKVVNKVGQLIE
jgi:hypothetical protein